MKIGIAYDTRNMYNINENCSLFNDFASIESINTLKNVLVSKGYQTILLGNTQQIADLIRKDIFHCDLVYNTVEGLNSRNREGLLPALLEIYDIPYIGTDSFGLSLSLDKALTKVLAEKLGILTPKFIKVFPSYTYEYIKLLLNDFNMPVIIKPNFEGNSSGIKIARTIDEATENIMQIIKLYNSLVLCEEFIFGKEITVPLIGNIVSEMIWGVTAVDIQRNNEFWLDTETKQLGDYKNIIADLPSGKELEFKDISVKLFNEIGCHDFARFDFRMTSSGNIYFIEVNPLPSLFIGGSFDVVGNKYGYEFAETIDLIVKSACKRLSIPRI